MRPIDRVTNLRRDAQPVGSSPDSRRHQRRDGGGGRRRPGADGLGADGAGSIRVPAAFCGLFALAPSRGRISTMPDPEHWHGLTVFGGLARSVLDAAVFDDALRGPAPGDRYMPPEPETSFAQAAAREPMPLRVAVSIKGAILGSDRPGRPPSSRGDRRAAARTRARGRRARPDLRAALKRHSGPIARRHRGRRRQARPSRPTGGPYPPDGVAGATTARPRPAASQTTRATCRPAGQHDLR